MSSVTLAALVERLEKAEGPSRELDGEIATAAHGWKFVCEPVQGWLGGGSWWEDAAGKTVRLPPYTASVDSALTLVPEGWEWQVSNRAPKPLAGRAYIHNRELISGGAVSHNPKYRGQEATAATPALALCIAALRARAAGRG